MEQSKSWGHLEGKGLRFKLELGLLSIAIALFALSSFVYSYQPDAVLSTFSAAAAMASFPYRMYAVSFVGFGSILMVAASISYQRRSKQLV